jgi:threonine synthase
MIDIEYDLERVRFVDSDNPYERYADLLPVEDRALYPSDARFTPTIHAKELGAALGLPHLYLKNETALPTCTTKDRMAAVAMAYLYECGVRKFCTSSTGNSSTAYARAIANFDEMHMCLFTASDFRDRVQCDGGGQVEHYILRGATFVEAFDQAREFAKQNDYTSERGFFNPGRREGLKVAWLEAVEQVPRPIDWYVQAVSSAMGVYGTFKGANELVQLGRIPHAPRLMCVQQETCSPMVQAWNDDAPGIRPEHIFPEPTGIAKAILRGNPTGTYPRIRKIVKESNGTILAVSEEAIREAQRIVYETEGVRPCFSASTAVAGLISAARGGRLPADHTVLINLTGGDRDAPAASNDARWLARSDDGWVLEPAPQNAI